jgi:hypothetical protein
MAPTDDPFVEQCQFVCLDPKVPRGAWSSQIFAGSKEDLAWVRWYWAEGAGWQALSQARATQEVYIRTRTAGLSDVVRGSHYQPTVDEACRFKERFVSGNTAPSHYGSHPVPPILGCTGALAEESYGGFLTLDEEIRGISTACYGSARDEEARRIGRAQGRPDHTFHKQPFLLIGVNAFAGGLATPFQDPDQAQRKVLRP